MSAEKNKAVALTFLQNMASGAAPESVAALFAEDLEWNIPGNESAFPWIGNHSGRSAVINFLVEGGRRIERTHFAVHDILAGEERAMIYGDLAFRHLATGRSAETPFVIVLGITEGLIRSFLMMENGVAVAKSARLE